MSDYSLHHKVEGLFGSGDLRLLYGMGVPFLLVIGFTILLWATNATWLIVPLFLTIFAFTAIVLKGLSYMLNDEDGSDES